MLGLTLHVEESSGYCPGHSYLVCFQGNQWRETVDFSSGTAQSAMRIVTCKLDPVHGAPDLCFWWYTMESDDARGTLTLEARGAIPISQLLSSLDKHSAFSIPLVEDTRNLRDGGLAVANASVAPSHKFVLSRLNECLKQNEHKADELYHNAVIPAYLSLYKDKLKKATQAQMKPLHGRDPPGCRWMFGSTLFPTPNGAVEMPMWFMSLGASKQTDNGWDLEDVKLACLHACLRLKFMPSEVASFTEWQLREVGCQAANLLSLSFQYRPDHIRSRANDQWTFIAHAPRVEETGADCEDLSEYTLRVMKTMQAFTVQAQRERAGSLEERVLTALQGYEFCLAIATLCVKEDQGMGYEYHCLVVGLDAKWLEEKRQSKHTSGSILPALVIESTDFTTSTQHAFEVDTSYDTLESLPKVFTSDVLVRDTAYAAEQDKEYGHILSILCPRPDSDVVQFDLYNTDHSFGVPFETFASMKVDEFTCDRITVIPEVMDTALAYYHMLPAFLPLPKLMPLPRLAHVLSALKMAEVVGITRGFQVDETSHADALNAITDKVEEYATKSEQQVYCETFVLYERCTVRLFLLHKQQHGVTSDLPLSRSLASLRLE